MKIILVVPPVTEGEMLNYEPEMVMINPPLGMAYIAAYVREKGYQVEIIDAIVDLLSFNKTVDRIIAGKPDIVGLSSSTISHPIAEKLAKTLKEKLNNIPIVIGGPHFAALPQRTLASPNFDFGVYGEGEESFYDLMQYVEGKLAPEKILGIAYKNKEGKVIVNPPRPLIKDIDSIPMPARDLLPPLTSYRPSTKYSRWPVTTMMSSRGCPFKCVFCDKSSFGDTFRGHSPERMVSEIKYLIQNYGIKEINFYDDNFLYDLKRVEQFCDLLIKDNVDITWSCEGRVHSMTLELGKKLRKAGCWQVSFGIESGNQNVLNAIKKGIRIDQIKKAIDICDKVGIMSKGYFQIGLPTDTKESIQDTINFAKLLPLDTANFNITVPYPGAPLYKNASDFGDFDEKNFEHYMVATDKPVFIAKGLTAEYLVAMQKKAYKEFYMRPQYMFRRLTKIRSLWDIKKNFKGFLSYFKYTSSSS